MRTGIATLVVLLFFLAVLLATSAAHAQVIHACAKNQSGALRLVASTAECGQNEAEVSWNQAAPLRLFDLGRDLGQFVWVDQLDLQSVLVFVERLSAIAEINLKGGTVPNSGFRISFEPRAFGGRPSRFSFEGTSRPERSPTV